MIAFTGSVFASVANCYSQNVRPTALVAKLWHYEYLRLIALGLYCSRPISAKFLQIVKILDDIESSVFRGNHRAIFCYLF